MKLHQDSIVQLHDLYHRKEDRLYIVGSPETGEHITLTALEFRALQLIHSDLPIKRIQEILDLEHDKINLYEFIEELQKKGFVHKVGNKTITPKYEPVHEFDAPVAWIGGRTAAFIYLLASIFGVWNLFWRGSIPGPNVFFIAEELSVTLIFVIFVAWLVIAFRQLVKHGAALSLGLQSRFSFTNHYHAFVPKTNYGFASEQQQHHILGVSLLSLTAVSSIMLFLATKYPGTAWSLAFALCFIEILSECLLFLDTDLAKFIAINANVHKLNKRTESMLKEDIKHLFRGAQRHKTLTTYAFFYLLSIALAVILLGVYLLPAFLGFVVLAFSRLNPSHPLFADAMLALVFLTANFMFYGFSVLRHHHLNHHRLFLNTALLSIVAGSYLLATLSVQWFAYTTGLTLGIIMSYGTGLIIAVIFEFAVLEAHPFTELHGIFERAALPIVAAFVPISLLFTSNVTNIALYAAALGVGMMTALVLRQYSR